MRLTETQVKEIIEAVDSQLTQSYELFLVGSRTSDQKKGGDIDLLIISDHWESIRKKKNSIKNAVQAQPSIDDIKTDVVIASQEELKKDPFLKSLEKNKIKLA